MPSPGKRAVVIIGSSLKATPGTDYASFVATDNYHGGVLAAREMVKLLNGKVKVVLAQYMRLGQHDRPRRAAMIYQKLSRAPHLSVMENILLGMEPGARWRSRTCADARPGDRGARATWTERHPAGNAGRIAIGGTKMDLPNRVRDIVTGAIIIFAVALDQWRHRRSSV